MNSDILYVVFGMLSMRDVMICGMVCKQWRHITHVQFKRSPDMFVFQTQNPTFVKKYNTSMIRLVRAWKFHGSIHKFTSETSEAENLTDYLITHVPNNINRKHVRSADQRRIYRITKHWLRKYFRNEQDLHRAITCLCDNYVSILYEAVFATDVLNKIIYLYIIINHGQAQTPHYSSLSF